MNTNNEILFIQRMSLLISTMILEVNTTNEENNKKQNEKFDRIIELLERIEEKL